MATIKSSLQLYDGMTPVLKSITKALNMTLNSFEAVQSASGKAINVRALQAAREELARAAAGYDNIEREIKEATAAQQKLNSGASGLVGKFGALAVAAGAAFGARGAIQLIDQMSSVSARVNLINDGLQTNAELSDKIFASANRAGAVYADTAAVISKMGLSAAKAFSGNDELIRFTELMNKNFQIGGASIQEQTSAMHQLSQAMGSGRLQGDEYRSIIENAPLLANAIEDYMRNAGFEGTMKEWASDGLLTANVIKEALFSSADEIEERYARMPKTFGVMWTIVSNNLIKAMQPAMQWLTAQANYVFDNWSKIAPVFYGIGNTVVWAVQSVFAVFSLGAGIFMSLMPAIMGLLAGYAAYWVMTNATMLYSVAIQRLVAARIWAVTIAQGAWAAVTGVTTKAMALLNLVLSLSPIGWVIALVAGAIAIFSAWIVKTHGVRQVFSDVFGAIVDIVEGAINFILGKINVLIRGFNAIGGFIGKIMGFEYGGIQEIQYRADFSKIKAVGQDLIENVTFQGILDRFRVDSEGVGGGGFSDFGGDMADTAANTAKMAKSMELAEEDLRYMRDIAERDAINRFTTAEISVTLGGVTLNEASKRDLDGVVEYLEEKLFDTMQAAAEGVY